MADLGIALQITLLGMSLVFGAIILVTLLMSLLVKITSARQQEKLPTPVNVPVELTLPEEISDDLQRNRMQKAAAAAVAYALVLEQRSSLPNPIRASRPRPISPWQATQRGQLFNQRGRK